MDQIAAQPPKSNKNISLASLNRRFLASAGLAVLGAWGLLAPRLDLFLFLKDDPGLRHIWFYVDVAGLTLNIFGLFSVYYYYQRLKKRFKRLEVLGEQYW